MSAYDSPIRDNPPDDTEGAFNYTNPAEDTYNYTNPMEESNPFSVNPSTSIAASAPPLPQTGDYERKMQALIEREKRLKEREDEVQTRELAAARGRPAPNWPCPCHACALYHHAIASVPGQSRCFVRLLYTTWLLTALTLLANCTVYVMLFASDGMNANSFKLVSFSFLFFFLGTPFSFRLWYWPTYSTLQKGKQPSSLRFNFIFLIHIIFFTFGAIGLSGWGLMGWLQVKRHGLHVDSYASLACATLWSVTATLSFVVACRSTKVFARVLVLQELASNPYYTQLLIGN